MAQFSPGPYRLSPDSPVIIQDANGLEICRASVVGNRRMREANARLFKASYSYHVLGYELAMLDVDASLYGSDPRVRQTVDQIAAIHREVEGR